MAQRITWFIVASFTFSLSACQDGHLNILGYSTAPNYDLSIRTVYVPIFQNVTLRRGLEFDLTRAVIREIEAKTPYKVVCNREQADTELVGKIVSRRKTLINQNQLGETREAEVGIAVEVTWRDLRAGRLGDVLTAPPPKPQDPLAPPEPGVPPPPPPPVLIQPVATFLPELGGSLGSAEKQIVDHLAVQIISMMETWRR